MSRIHKKREMEREHVVPAARPNTRRRQGTAKRLEFGEGVPFTIDWRTMDEGRAKYQAYLCSREWSEKKRAVHERCGGICERCGLHQVDAVHHLSYEHKYDERLEELAGWCKGCHEFTHGKSDRDPLEQAKERMRVISPLACSLRDGWTQSETLVVCPVTGCGCKEVHIAEIADEKHGAHGEGLAVRMWCESGHEWFMVFETHKGTTHCWTVDAHEVEP